MAAPSVADVVRGALAFAAANPTSTRADVRDHLVATFGGTAVRAVNAVVALERQYALQGYEDDPDPANVSWAHVRNRASTVGNEVALRIAVNLTLEASRDPDVRVYVLSLERDELVTARDELRNSRDALVTLRDAQFPSGRPDRSDPAGQGVWDALTEAIRRLTFQIQQLNAKVDAAATQIAALGG